MFFELESTLFVCRILSFMIRCWCSAQLFDSLRKTKGQTSTTESTGSSCWKTHFPLHAAAEAGNREEVERILDRPGSYSEKLIDSLDGLDRTALHYAAGRGRLEVVDLLLNKGARSDATDMSHQTPLHKAAAVGSTSVCRTLALALADTNAVCNGGVTPLMLAAKAADLECVQVCLVVV